MLLRHTLCLLLLSCLLGCSLPLKKRNLLVIGDSNGAAADGWVVQLQQIRGGGPLVNTAIAGNTIGFTDAGRMERNTLENLSAYLRRGYAEMGGVDEILIGLGTNDCKTQFADRHDEIAPNLDTLLDRTAGFFASRGQEMPRIVLVTPPPVAADDRLIDKFQGASDCVASFATKLRAVAAARGYCLVDWLEHPGDRVLSYSSDGIHFSAEGYELLAREVVDQCY